MKLFDKNDEGRVDYYEFISALHPREQYVPTNDAEKIEDEVIREVARCRCCDRFAVHQISDNKYRVSFHNAVLYNSFYNFIFSLEIPNNFVWLEF